MDTPAELTPRGSPKTAYHTETRLKDGRSSLLLDIGSVGNLAGDEWVQNQARIAVHNKRKPEQYKRERPLNVSGVGNGSQSCTFNCKLPIAIQNKDGKFTKGTFDTPTVPKSMLPALLGLDSTRRCRGIIDTNTLVLYLCGPGDYDLSTSLPPGTESIQCEIAPSGHMVIPCSDFEALDKSQRYGGLTLEHEVALPAVISDSGDITTYQTAEPNISGALVAPLPRAEAAAIDATVRISREPVILTPPREYTRYDGKSSFGSLAGSSSSSRQ